MKKLKLSFSILIPLFLLSMFGISAFADEDGNVFNNYSFPEKGYYAIQDDEDKGIGSSNFKSDYVDSGTNNKNKVIVNSTGDENTNNGKENYIDFSYGSKGGSNTNKQEDRYVNFQMELNDRLRFNNDNTENMVDGDNTTITYKQENHKIKSQSLTSPNTKIIKYNKRKIYVCRFDTTKYYHSGQINVRLYLKSNIINENAYDKDGNYPLINLYYKSGSDDYENKKISAPVYHVFQIAQTLRFKDVKDKVLAEMNDSADILKQKINNLFNNSPEDSNILNNQVNNNSKRNIGILNGVYHLDQLISEKQDMSDNLEQSLHLLRLKNVPNTFNFNNASTNDGTSNLSNNSITNNNIGISSFNEPNLNIDLKLSNLTNSNNQSLQNANFKVNNNPNVIYPNNSFNYRTVNNIKNGYIKYGIYPITLNYTKGVMPSGTYTGTATWDISPKVNDNGITIKK
ncbi:hypothetical protein [Apilactobacillus micheneri]|uniref:Uncharacterized protein n=1 Tax=Apilactobacillus micheneri TaxID=1899430 RepID=A0A9Q8INP0_9LACO|nr:hypothetical protein [Apilactobacillus micheneri]TPR40094.1 hypothetical protein DY121_04450 [Apilactobacillus micheneri]TPR41905.1 hypothetical protein DY123_05070 [Apilactobacillus micheneri]TPR44296.1 hypothetical protein DY130_04445 [Apilactobacillus micheneri]TPR45920.1 hypothetical protein DY128_04445 [Apilactobacillus micheneri]TPR51680.1 hypothetical protein DY126_04505 [Apilactobacillus micheneri]